MRVKLAGAAAHRNPQVDCWQMFGVIGVRFDSGGVPNS
jgi:hypothetical protein